MFEAKHNFELIPVWDPLGLFNNKSGDRRRHKDKQRKEKITNGIKSEKQSNK